jgi:hypothetical protein
MGWIPEHQRTTVWYLFNKLFQVRINPLHARTAEEIKLYGTPTTGNEDYDRELDKNEHVVMWSIARMEAHYADGHPIKLVKREDCEEVYRLVNNHLMRMKEAQIDSENFKPDPKTMDELIRLDNFADAVFQHARHGLKSNLQHAGYARRAKARDPFARLAELTRAGKVGGTEEKVTLPGNSSVGRSYGTAENLPPVEPVVENGMVQLDPIVEDPNLPKRISLAQLFEDRKKLGTQWN